MEISGLYRERGRDLSVKTFYWIYHMLQRLEEIDSRILLLDGLFAFVILISLINKQLQV